MCDCSQRLSAKHCDAPHLNMIDHVSFECQKNAESLTCDDTEIAMTYVKYQLQS